MKRRTVWLATTAAALGAALAMPRAHGQTGQALRRVGVLRIGDPAAGTAGSQALIDALQQHGFANGRDIVLEARSADGRTEGLARLAAELAALKPAVIVTYGPQATHRRWRPARTPRWWPSSASSWHWVSRPRWRAPVAA